MEDIFDHVQAFNMRNEEIFRFTQPEKKEKKKRLTIVELSFMIYMIVTNLFLIFYLHIVGKEKFSSRQGISNFVYNSSCIFAQCFSFVLFPGNKKFSRFQTIFKFFLITKTYLDYFNLINLTPSNCVIEIFTIFFFLLFVNLFLLTFYTRFYINLDFKSLYIVLIMLVPSSILSSYLFRKEGSYNSTQFIALEFVKIIFYFFITLIHLEKIRNRKKEIKSSNQINSLEDLNQFYFESLKNSHSYGFVIVENLQDLYYNANYFENILHYSKEREKTRSRRKNTNQFSNFSNFRSPTEISNIPMIKKEITPILKLEPTTRATKKQVSHIQKNSLQNSDLKLKEGEIPNFSKFSTKDIRNPKKKKLSLSCKCVVNPSRRASRISAKNENVVIELDTDLIRMNFDVNITSSRRESFAPPSRKNFSSINFRNKKSLDKIEEVSDRDSKQDMDEDIKIKPKPVYARKSDLIRMIPKIKNFEKIHTERKTALRKDTYDKIISDDDYQSSSSNSSDEDIIQNPIRNSINIRGPIVLNSIAAKNLRNQTDRQNSGRTDCNPQQNEFITKNNHTGSYDLDSPKSRTLKEDTSKRTRENNITSRFNPKSSSGRSNNIENQNNKDNNKYNININNNQSQNSHSNIQLQIINNDNNDETIPIGVRRKETNRKNSKLSKKSKTFEEHIFSNYNTPHIMGSLFVEEYPKDRVISRKGIHNYLSNVSSEQMTNGMTLDRFLFELVKNCQEKLEEFNTDSYEEEFGPYVILFRDKQLGEEERYAKKIYLSFALKIMDLSHFTNENTSSKFTENYDTSRRNMCFIMFKDHALSRNVPESNNRKKTELVSQVAHNLRSAYPDKKPVVEYNSEIIGLKVNENESEYLINSPPITDNKYSNINYPYRKPNVSLRKMVDSLREKTYKNDSSKSICEIQFQDLKHPEQNTAERDSIQFKPFINNNNALSSHKYSVGNNLSCQRYSGSSSSSNQLFLAKISAMLHDFKHIVLDNTYFFKYLIKQYGVALKIEDMLYIKTMKKYVHFLVKNLTSFFNDQNNFLKGDARENHKAVDITQLLDNLIAVFNRRLQFENSKNENNLIDSKFKKNVKIYHKILDPENPSYQKLISNKNLLMTVFYNLLSNAYKETENGEILAETSINVLRKEILVRIIDTGRGMPETVKKNWGLPFHKFGDNAGTGLGQFIIETVKNSLKLYIPRPEDNPNGKGTIISVYIPLEDSNPGSLKLKSNSNSIITRKETFMHEINQEEKRMLQREIIWESNSRPNQSPQMSENMINYVLTKIVYNVLVFDDDSFVLRVFQEKVEKELKYASMKWEFEFVYVKNFESFYEELCKMLTTEKKVFDFFVLDQNIALNIKGVDVAEIICKLYDAFNLFDRKVFNFIFMTEESNLIESYLSSNKSISNNFARYADKIFHPRGENIFGKVEMKFIKNRIIEMLEKMQEMDQ